MSTSNSGNLTSAIEKVSQAIDASITRIGEDATTKEKRSARQRVWDMVFRATTAILAVAAPALVTYSTTPDVHPAYKLAAILFSGIAGAAATLQAIFALQQNYVRNAIAALDLHELKAELEADKDAGLQRDQDYERYADLKVALSNATRKHKDITIAKQRAYLEKIANE